MAQFKKAMAFERNRFNATKKNKAHVAQDDADDHDDGSTMQETVRKATDGLKSQQLAKQIIGAVKREGAPPRTCWKWYKKSACDNHAQDKCGWEHPAAWKGKGAKTKLAATRPRDTGAAASGTSTKGSAEPDGPVKGTSCAQCGKFPCVRENGRQGCIQGRWLT